MKTHTVECLLSVAADTVSSTFVVIVDVIVVQLSGPFNLKRSLTREGFSGDLRESNRDQYVRLLNKSFYHFMTFY